MDQEHQQQARAADAALRSAMQGASAILLALVLMAGAWFAAYAITGSTAPYFPVQFLRTQDFPVAILFALFWALALPIGASWLNLEGLSRKAAAGAPRSAALILALLAVVVCAAGVWLVFGGYGLVMDEHWARSDAAVLGTGSGMVRIPEIWRDYAPALQPKFARITPDGWWASLYLPVNAALHYLGGNLASPLLVGAAVLIASDLARRLLPEAPHAPLLCALLMVTSSQLIITGMTPFAMSAHLAFNLAWLWLFLRPGWRAQAAAVPVAILAIGLHQLVFFPLFAAAFLCEAWLAGKRRAAAVQALAIGAGLLFWSAYDTVLYAALGTQPIIVTDSGSGTGTGLLLTRVIWLVSQFTPANLGMMAISLIRFITWQDVLILPLALIGLRGLWRTPGPWRAMVCGILLTIAAMTVLLADQQHGWGYRYLHGHLGSACLLATLGWYRLPAEVRAGSAARTVLGAGLVVSALLLPLRAWQAASYVAPYARADAAIAAIDADVVLIDTPQHLFALDLVRNDPFLRNRPKRMAAMILSDAQLARLCRTFTVARFTDADAGRFGMHALDTGLLPRALPQGCRASR